MEEYIKKADILIEALPYIKAFHGKIFVLKCGGNALANKGILQDLIFMHYVGLNPILVHGGGHNISQKMQEKGLTPKFVHGFRKTDSQTMKIVEEELEKVNQMLVEEIRRIGAPAKGLTARNSKIVLAKKKKMKYDLGFLGEVVKINTAPIKKLLRAQVIPVISPVGWSKAEGRLYNVNADDAASEIAAALGAEKFILLTDVRGIMREKDNPSSLITTLTEAEAEGLIKRNIIQEGMLVKVKACVTALKKGVKKTHIIDGRITHSSLLEIFTDKGIGTEIVK
jgi:acetylglutamate kinase